MKKGFTLIELLAVIVILAIIALIATPIVLNIINDARESSTLRSADFYLDAVEYTIADAVLYQGGIEDGTYPITADGDLCRVELDEDGVCPEIDNKSNILEVEVNGEKPSSGTITIENGNIEDVYIILNDKKIINNSKNELIYHPCTLIEGTEKANGSKYECEVKEGTKYNFYVLSQESNGTTNLIMDRNINSDGTLVTKAIPSSSPENLINIPNINFNYEDNGTYGYGGIKTTNNITKITMKDGSVTTTY